MALQPLARGPNPPAWAGFGPSGADRSRPSDSIRRSSANFAGSKLPPAPYNPIFDFSLPFLGAAQRRPPMATGHLGRRRQRGTPLLDPVQSPPHRSFFSFSFLSTERRRPLAGRRRRRRCTPPRRLRGLAGARTPSFLPPRAGTAQRRAMVARSDGAAVGPLAGARVRPRMNVPPSSGLAVVLETERRRGGPERRLCSFPHSVERLPVVVTNTADGRRWWRSRYVPRPFLG